MVYNGGNRNGHPLAITQQQSCEQVICESRNLRLGALTALFFCTMINERWVSVKEVMGDLV